MTRPAAAPGDPRPIVLALVGYYPPAFLAGGPTRSIPGIVRLLAGEFDLRVITRDRDLGSTQRLPGITPDHWIPTADGPVRYVDTRAHPALGVVFAIRRTPHAVLYVNSVFSVQFGLLPLLLRRLGLLSRRGLVIAPRGELDPHALAFKGMRKRLVLTAARFLGLTHGAVWHAATDEEAAAVRREFGAAAKVRVARDLPVPPGDAGERPPKEPGRLAVAFLGRIARIKNLDLAIRAFREVEGDVTFDVYGPIEDGAYWADCLALSTVLPNGVRLAHRGAVPPDEVTGVLGRHHLLFLPTRGESFGHAIVEALLAGCPVLVSDQTPWRGLEARRAGWDVPLGEPESFAAILRACVAMTAAEYEVWSEGARRFGREILEDPALDAAYRAVFRAALSPVPLEVPAR